MRLDALEKEQLIYAGFKLKNILKPEEYFLLLAIEKNDTSSIRYFDFIENSILLKVISNRKDFYSLIKTQVEVKLDAN